MFQGTHALLMDAKGRIAIPTGVREQFAVQSEGRVTLTRHPQGCLLLYARPSWEAVRDNLMRLPASHGGLQRIMLGGAEDLQLDSAGRVLISPVLRKLAGLEREIMMIGLGSRFELWDAVRHAEQERQEAVLAQEQLGSITL